MSLDGTFIFDRRATFLKGLAVFVAGLVGCVVCVFVAGRLVIAPAFAVAWGAYLMLRAAKAGKNLSEIEGALCAQCSQAIASVMVGQFCTRCSKPIHNNCLAAHVQSH
jgi:hypothetical protein